MAHAARAVAVSLLLLVSAGTLLAQGLPTATLTGRVTASDGSVLPGVTVAVHSANLQGTRATTTTSTGDYIFNLLPPGDYTVTFEMEGMQGIRRKVALSAARSERVDAILRPAAVSEAITVTAETPVTAALETTQVSTNFRQELIEQLPVDRTIRGVTLLAPGVNSNGPSGNIMISGAMSFQSLYVVNGAIVNENLRNQPQDLFIEDAIQETTVLTGGISAEYGHSTGGIVNVITKSGSNNFSGSYRANFTNDKWTAQTPLREKHFDDLNTTHEGTLGGPLFRDRLWFFGAGRYSKRSESRQTLATPRTSDINPTPYAYEYGVKETRLEGKLTGTITPRHTLVASYIDVKNTETNYSFGTIMDAASLVPTRDTPKSLLSLSYNGILSDRLFVEGLHSRREFSFIGGGCRFTDLIRGTLIQDRSRGNARFNCATFRRPKDQPEQRDNRYYLLKGSYFLATPAFGTHDLRVGLEHFGEKRVVNNYQTGSDYRISAPTAIIRGSQIFPSFPTGTGTRIQWQPILVPTKGADYKTKSAFVNDVLHLRDRWSFNLGLRYDKNDARDAAGSKIADDGTWSPRLAAHYDIRGNGRWIVTASYGKYADKLSEGAANDADPGGRQSNLVWNYRGPSINADVNAPTDKLVPTDQALKTLFDWFFANGGTNLRPLRSVSVPGFDSRIATGGIDTPHMTEYTLGFGARFSANGYARVDLVHRDWRDFYTSIINTSTGKTPPFPGTTTRFDMSIIGNSNSYERTYEAAQTQFSYRITRRLSVGGTYTWSRLTGNLTGETVGDGPVVGGADEYPEYRRKDWDSPVGYLGADQRHRARVWAGYDLNTSFGNFNVSVLELYDSGTAYSINGVIDSTPYVQNPGYVTPPATVSYFFGPRGGKRNDDVTRTDLALNYRVKLMRGVELFIEPEILNLFNEQAIVSVSDRVLTAVDDSKRFKTFNPFTEKPVRGVNWDLDENFGKPTAVSSYQTPRTYRFSVGLRF